MKIGGMLGVYTSLKESKDGKTWIWKVKQYGQEIGTGSESSKAKAEVALKRCAIEHLYKKAVTAEERGIARWKLKQMVIKRPYLVAGLCQLLFLNVDKKRFMLEIKSYEKALCENDDPKRRVPISTHHRTLSAEDAGLKAIEHMRLGGLLEGEWGEWESRRLKKWALNMFGPALFSDAPAEDPYSGESEDGNDE